MALVGTFRTFWDGSEFLSGSNTLWRDPTWVFWNLLDAPEMVQRRLHQGRGCRQRPTPGRLCTYSDNLQRLRNLCSPGVGLFEAFGDLMLGQSMTDTAGFQLLRRAASDGRCLTHHIPLCAGGKAVLILGPGDMGLHKPFGDLYSCASWGRESCYSQGTYACTCTYQYNV